MLVHPRKTAEGGHALSHEHFIAFFIIDCRDGQLGGLTVYFIIFSFFFILNFGTFFIVKSSFV